MTQKLSKRGERLYYRTVRCTQTICKRLYEKEQTWLSAISIFMDNEFTLEEAANKWCCVIGTAINRLGELIDANLVERIQKHNKKLGHRYKYKIIVD